MLVKQTPESGPQMHPHKIAIPLGAKAETRRHLRFGDS
jgi:hypothetical protein